MSTTWAKDSLCMYQERALFTLFDTVPKLFIYLTFLGKPGVTKCVKS